MDTEHVKQLASLLADLANLPPIENQAAVATLADGVVRVLESTDQALAQIFVQHFPWGE